VLRLLLLLLLLVVLLALAQASGVWNAAACELLLLPVQSLPALQPGSSAARPAALLIGDRRQDVIRPSNQRNRQLLASAHGTTRHKQDACAYSSVGRTMHILCNLSPKHTQHNTLHIPTTINTPVLLAAEFRSWTHHVVLA